MTNELYKAYFKFALAVWIVRVCIGSLGVGGITFATARLFVDVGSALAVGGSTLLTTVGFFAGYLWEDRRARHTARWLAAIAAVIAGRRRMSGYREWLGDLAGVPEEGRPLNPATQRRYARGLLWAAIRMRLNDLTRAAGRLLDWLLTTDVRVLNTIATVVGYAAYVLARHGGLIEVISNIENLGVLTGGLWGLAFVLRRVRGVTATDRKPRKTTEHQRPE